MLMPLEAEGRTGFRIQDSGFRKGKNGIQDSGVRSQNEGHLLFADCLLLTADCLLHSGFGIGEGEEQESGFRIRDSGREQPDSRW
jgi:hypothetical protein